MQSVNALLRSCPSLPVITALAFSFFFIPFFTNASNATQSDFNGDGFGDILYRDTDNLTWRLDLMSGATVISSIEMSSMSSCCGWLFNGSGDFDGDGNHDVIIRNTTSGAWYIYNIDSGSVIGRGYVAIEDATIVGVQAVADFNLDGNADVLLRNEETGEWTMTLLNNRTIVQEYTPNMSTVLSWSVVDAKDYDSNGSPDILIRNSTSGAWYVYLYSGLDITSRGYITTVLPSDLDEQVQGVADFDGDGANDLLLRNLATNAWSIAFMNGLAPKSLSSIGINSSSSWEFNAANDFDNDGYADISLRNPSSGAIYIYFMNGTTILSEGSASATITNTLQATSLIPVSAPNTDVVESENNVPVANAGEDQSVNTGVTVTLDGSASSDSDAGDILSYSWSLSVPSESASTLSKSNTVNPTFVPDVAGSYAATLVVNDGTDNSQSDTVSITATAPTSGSTTITTTTQITNSFSENRFDASTKLNRDARPYVWVDFIDHDNDGTSDAALLQSNGVPSTYDYDHTTSDAADISDICFDDPTDGPVSEGGSCYKIEPNVRAFVIPLAPTLASTVTTLQDDDHSGIALSGATFEIPTAPNQSGSGYAVTNDYPNGWEVLDDCNGHAGTGGAPYHYHGDPTYPNNDGNNDHTDRASNASQCLPGYDLTIDESTGHGPLIGYMADGFPIYGTDGYDVDSNNPLDSCNGHDSVTSEYPDGTYHYHALSAEVATATGLPPLPECLSGQAWLIPRYQSPELTNSASGQDTSTQTTAVSTNTTVNATLVESTFLAARFSAKINPSADARPYVHANFIDWDHDGTSDAAILQTNGVPSTYDYDYTTADSSNISDICFDDPNSGPDVGCYPIEPSNRVFIIPLNPTLGTAADSGADDHNGVAISGATFETPTAPVEFSAGYAVTNEYPEGWEVLDDCNGHSGFEGAPYHYHGDPSYPINDGVNEHTLAATDAADCLPEYTLTVDSETGHGPLIGFMADGFPIYGSDGYDIDKKNNNIDDCNGHTGETPEFPDGIYHYHALNLDAVTSPGEDRRELPPLPECLSGEVLVLPNYQSPELND